MTLVTAIARPLGASLTLLGVLAACAGVQPANPGRQAEIAACRTRADEVFQKQNRYLLSQRGNLDAPGSGLDPDPDKSIGTAALAGRFGRDQQVSDCARGSGGSPVSSSLPAAADRTDEPPTQ